MISEVDLRDWDKVDFTLVYQAESEVDSRLDYREAFNLLYRFSNQVESLKEKQFSKIPKLERK